MKIVPAHRISYKGTFYREGDVVEVDERDAEDMRKYAKMVFDDDTRRGYAPAAIVSTEQEMFDEDGAPINATAENVPLPRRGGRPKKV